MFTQKFTATFAPLKLMNVGERGIVIRLNQSGDGIRQKLESMGLVLGSMITLEQRFPDYIIRTGNDRITLGEDVLYAVRVRVIHD